VRGVLGRGGRGDGRILLAAVIERWSKEDPEAPSAAELVRQLHEVLYGPDHPLPLNVVLHWDRLLEEVEDATFVEC
jgi:hypothetical protein